MINLSNTSKSSNQFWFWNINKSVSDNLNASVIWLNKKAFGNLYNLIYDFELAGLEHRVAADKVADMIEQGAFCLLA